MHAGTAVLGGAVVFEMGPGQWLDVIGSLVTMPRGFALFEGCRLSRVPPCSLSMIEAWLREDETAWDREVNEDLLCLQVIFTSWWIIQRLLRTSNHHRESHTHTHTGNMHADTQMCSLLEATQLRRKKLKHQAGVTLCRARIPFTDKLMKNGWQKSFFSFSKGNLLQFRHTT